MSVHEVYQGGTMVSCYCHSTRSHGIGGLGVTTEPTDYEVIREALTLLTSPALASAALSRVESRETRLRELVARWRSLTFGELPTYEDYAAKRACENCAHELESILNSSLTNPKTEEAK
jgi:hypothetical protein